MAGCTAELLPTLESQATGEVAMRFRSAQRALDCVRLAAAFSVSKLACGCVVRLCEKYSAHPRAAKLVEAGYGNDKPRNGLLISGEWTVNWVMAFLTAASKLADS